VNEESLKELIITLIYKVKNLIVNFILDRSNLMATLAQIVDDVNAIKEGVAAVDLKLDDIRALVAALKAGTITQEELDALAAKIAEVKAATVAIVAEAQGVE
jgi:hypothetical protein